MIHTSRDTINAREGEPRVVACLLRTDSAHLSFAGEGENCRLNDTRVRFAIVGTDYGWLHNSMGDYRFWSSYSAARRHLKRHVLPFNYGDKRDFRKIDLFDSRGRYLASTTWARDCSEALQHATNINGAVAYTARYAR